MQARGYLAFRNGTAGTQGYRVMLDSVPFPTPTQMHFSPGKVSLATATWFLVLLLIIITLRSGDE